MLQFNELSKKAYDEVREFISTLPEEEGQKLLTNFQEKLDYLGTYACDKENPHKTRCDLYIDFADLSFSFAMHKKNEKGEYEHWFNGGLIYHGPHKTKDPLSVCIGKEDGWSIHT
jgi:hypothetical protein